MSMLSKPGGDDVDDSSAVDTFKVCLYCFKSRKTGITTKLFGQRDDDDKNDSVIIERLTKFLEIFAKGKMVIPDKTSIMSEIGCCDDCLVLIDSLCSLHRQLECLEMQLEWKLESLINVMKLANRVPSRIQMLRELFLKPGLNNDLTQVEKQETAQKRLEDFQALRLNIFNIDTRRLSERRPRVFVTNLDASSADDLRATPNSSNTFSLETVLVVKTEEAENPESMETDEGFHALTETGFQLEGAPNDNFSVVSEDNARDVQMEVESQRLAAIPKSEETIFHVTVKTESVVEEGVSSRKLSFCCKFCTKRYQNKRTLDWHLREHHSGNAYDAKTEKKKRFHCKPCNISFARYATLRKHKRSKTYFANCRSTQMEDGITVCKEEADIEMAERAAVKKESTEEDCNDSDTSTISNGINALPTTEKVGRYKLREKRQSTHVKMESHLSDGSDEESYSSESSFSESDHESVMDPQIKRKRGPESRLFTCRLDGCHRSWIHESEHLEHTKLHDKGVYQCNFCDAVEENSIKLCMHEANNHSTLKSDACIISCPRCPYESKKVYPYQEHFAEVHMKIFDKVKGRCSRYYAFNVECEICKLKLRESDLERHFKQVHDTTGMKPEEIPTCKVLGCDASFKTKEQLSAHKLQMHKSVKKHGQGRNANTTEFTNSENGNPTMFNCGVENCSQRFPNVKLLWAHHQLHASFKCQRCDITKYYAPDIAAHELEHLDSPEAGKSSKPHITKCPRCPTVFSTEHDYTDHFMETHLNNSNGTTGMCPICKTRSSGKSERNFRRKHFTTFHDINGIHQSDIKRCDHCPAYFLKSNQLIDHVVKIHFMGKCPECEQHFKVPSWLAEHLRQVHPTLKVFPIHDFRCDVAKCTQLFASEAELSRHKERHEKLKNSGNVCPKCGKTFQNKWNLNEHLEHHKGRDAWKYKCSTCGKKYAVQSRLTHHMKSHNKQLFSCQICDRKFSRCDGLTAHLHRMHPDKMNRDKNDTFVCDQCGKTFGDRRTLAFHLNEIHWDVSNRAGEHQCVFCEQYLKNKSLLDKHIKGHINEADYICQFCGMGTSRTNNLKLHMKRKHPNDMITLSSLEQ